MSDVTAVAAADAGAADAGVAASAPGDAHATDAPSPGEAVGRGVSIGVAGCTASSLNHLRGEVRLILRSLERRLRHKRNRHITLAHETLERYSHFLLHVSVRVNTRTCIWIKRGYALQLTAARLPGHFPWTILVLAWYACQPP